MLPIPGGPEGRDSAREIQGLNRGADRLSLRELRDRLAEEGPEARDAADLSSEEIRCEIAALSTFFIEETFTALWALLGEGPGRAGSPARRGSSFTARGCPATRSTLRMTSRTLYP